MATVGVGVAYEDDPLDIAFEGSGFFISDDGFFFTAQHVLEGCKIRRNDIKDAEDRETVDVVYSAFSWGGKVAFNVVPISKRTSVKVKGTDQGYPGPNDLDISVCKIDIRSGRTPFLSVSESGANIYDEVVICGYPGSNESLSVRNGSDGLRLSPIAQVGRIGGLLPADGVDKPYAIQTDIVGTIGSSGSPIVSLSDGQVIGVATDIIPTHVTTGLEQTGDARIGLTYGPGSLILQGLSTSVPAQLRSGVYSPVTIEISGLEFTFSGQLDS